MYLRDIFYCVFILERIQAHRFIVSKGKEVRKEKYST